MSKRAPKDTDARGQLGVINNVITSLAGKPPYIAVFGVIILVYFFYTAALMRGADVTYMTIMMAVMALIALATVWIVERQGASLSQIRQRDTEIAAKDAEIERLKQDLSTADRNDLNVDDEVAKTALMATIFNVRSALKYKNPLFSDEIYFRLKKLKEDSEDWADGDFLTDAVNYERILQLFYTNAVKSVFATSSEEYLKFWSAPQSASILKAHESAYRNHGASVERVFILSTFDNITKESIAIIKKHATPKYIVAKIFIFDESPGNSLGSSLFKDFVIVDQGEPSQATGVTNSFELGAMTAKWMVDADADTEQAAKFIRKNCVEVDEVEQRMKALG